MQRVHCYYRQHFMMTAKDRAKMMARFVAYAQQHGLELAGISTDTVDSNSRALTALRVAFAMEKGGLLAVPGLLHLAALGDTQAVVRELAAGGVAVVTVPLPFDQGPTRSTACEASSRGRSLSRRSRTSLTLLGRRTGPLSRAGERARSDWAAPRSPFHFEDLLRGSRSALLASSPSGAPRRGRREPGFRTGETGAAAPVASVAGAQGGATTVLLPEAPSVSSWAPEASIAQERSASPAAGCGRRQTLRAVGSALAEVQGFADPTPGPELGNYLLRAADSTTQRACGRRAAVQALRADLCRRQRGRPKLHTFVPVQ
jgi:hypothetical protein